MKNIIYIMSVYVFCLQMTMSKWMYMSLDIFSTYTLVLLLMAFCCIYMLVMMLLSQAGLHGKNKTKKLLLLNKVE